MEAKPLTCSWYLFELILHVTINYHQIQRYPICIGAKVFVLILDSNLLILLPLHQPHHQTIHLLRNPHLAS
jgi:hypothetical protein